MVTFKASQLTLAEVKTLLNSEEQFYEGVSRFLNSASANFEGGLWAVNSGLSWIRLLS